MTVAKKIGQCEVCDTDNIEVHLRYGNMYFCDDCGKKEDAAQAENMKPQNVAARIEAARNSPIAAPLNEVLRVTQQIDNSIAVRTDLFNAATMEIVKIKEVIDADESITNKPYALAEILKNRFEHFKNVIFEHQQVIVDASNNQRAIQVYLNNLANQLRQEEREKLKIQDINYRPNPVKQPTVKKLSTTATSPKKATKAEIKKAAMELGIAEFTLHAFVLQCGGNLEAAVKKIKASIEAAKQNQ